ncbi:Ubiquitin-conjugating enzyme E2 6 [Coemansia sp. RSA 2706]|nr:Ubiquitin-conjugating enzyme E2 6 [Coemansia sp. RSA 2706]KAJ2315558.1 Ubiquitin-conjugating enzyme E2 6 [Coemansia sp. RSA 2705]KAJ2322264.1 Ubiquitin-conjugating enzyme E2 6 [Coemansia sp. RSA 2704]KAJ2330022.1 Ubiquitin-conjugating enzyme E2 6 [Coemansia sp. RSA 2702]
MASKAAYKRLNKEYLAMQKNPTPLITAKPLESNILEWHYVVRGPPDTAYENGEYHGKLKFPSDYPYKPPAIQMITPSGRFQTNTNICMSMSNFHPDTWNPAWSVSTILNGMLSFMVEEEATTGSIRASPADRRALARKSHRFNLNNRQFRDVFPELCTTEPQPVHSVLPEEDQSQPDAQKPVIAPAAQLRQRAPVQAAGRAAAERPTGAAQPTGLWLAGLPRKWLILFVVVAYFFASKAVSRLLTA